MILESTIGLGNDSDCETCGPSYNHLLYQFEPATGKHTVQVSVGCYGGEEGTADLPGEAINFLAPYREWPGGAEVKELIRWLSR